MLTIGFLENDEFEILTPDGFEDFDGIKTSEKSSHINILFDDGVSLGCSLNHLLHDSVNDVKANSLKSGDSISSPEGCKRVDRTDIIDGVVILYDIVNAGKKHRYYTNNVLSHNCVFQGSSGSLINMKFYATIPIIKPIFEKENLKIYKNPREGRKYTATVDCAGGLGQDYSVITMFDVTEIPYEIVGQYRSNTVDPLTFPYVIESMCEEYNFAHVLVEQNTEYGGQVSYILYSEIEYENVIKTSSTIKGSGVKIGGRKSIPAVKMTKSVKGAGCANLKKIIESNRLIINDARTIEEMGTFVSNGKGSYEADIKCNDDTCMTLVIFAWLIRQDFFIDMFEVSIMESISKSLTEKEIPFGMGIVSSPYGGNGIGDEVYIPPREVSSSEDVFQNWIADNS